MKAAATRVTDLTTASAAASASAAAQAADSHSLDEPGASHPGSNEALSE
jgi:hypothetical protein